MRWSALRATGLALLTRPDPPDLTTSVTLVRSERSPGGCSLGVEYFHPENLDFTYSVNGILPIRVRRVFARGGKSAAPETRVRCGNRFRPENTASDHSQTGFSGTTRLPRSMHRERGQQMHIAPDAAE